MPEPNFQDRVRHKTSAYIVTGTVIAKYPDPDDLVEYNSIHLPGTLIRTRIRQLLDVRSDDDRIYWATPAENWETISTEEERFE